MRRTAEMQNPIKISELLASNHSKLKALKTRVQLRSQVLECVRSSLPAKLAKQVISAGVEQGTLKVGVSGAVWASRIRYFADELRKSIEESSKKPVLTIKIRVIPPAPRQVR